MDMSIDQAKVDRILKYLGQQQDNFGAVHDMDMHRAYYNAWVAVFNATKR